MPRYKVVMDSSVMVVGSLDNMVVAFEGEVAKPLKQLINEGRASLTIIAKRNELLFCPFCGSQVTIVAQSGTYICPSCRRVLNVEVEG